MTEKVQQIAIAAVRLDGGTQQRPTDKAIVAHYRDLRQDGIDLPPIEVVWDESSGCYWLWDGFHRLEAAQAMGQTKIGAHVRSGAREDAIWLSYSANKAHGVPRPPGTVRRIIEQILCNPAYAQVSISEIGEHVGTSRRYVQTVKNELLAQSEGGREPEERQECDPTVTNPDSDSAKAEKGALKRTLPRANTVKVRSSRGKVYEQQSQEKRQAASEGESVAVDADGVPIPADLQPIFAVVEQFDEFARKASRLRGEIEDAVEANPEAYAALSHQKESADLSYMAQRFREARPYLICPSCGGEDPEKHCSLCRGRQWLSRLMARTAAIEMRNLQRKAHGLPLLTGTSQLAGECTK